MADSSVYQALREPLGHVHLETNQLWIVCVRVFASLPFVVGIFGLTFGVLKML